MAGIEAGIGSSRSFRILRLDLVSVLVSILGSEQADLVDTRDGIDRIGKPASALESAK